MRKWRAIFLAAMFVASTDWPAKAFGPDDSKADRANIRIAYKQVRSQIITERIEGFKRLRDSSAQDAVKLIVPLGLTDPAEQVRRAAYETLLVWKDDRQIDVLLLKALEKETRTNKENISLVAPLIAVLLASELPETQHDLSKFLDAYVAASQTGVAAITLVADELGKQGDKLSLAALQNMTKLKCFSSIYACRRAIIQAVILVHLPKAIEILVAKLPEVDGETRFDILRHLATVSGQWNGNEAKNWQAWWEKNKDSFMFPVVESKTSFTATVLPDTPSYYGLPIYARRIVFVVDVSGSMEGPRLVAVKRELMQAIEGLHGDVSFNIVIFNDHAKPWRRSLAPATTEAKQAAQSFIYGLHAGGHTAAYDGLDLAFGFDIESIYFLSDGAPNAGKIRAPAAIVAAVTQTNRARRISIYTIGIAPGPPEGPLDLFVKTLAEQNFGVYRRIDR